MTAGGIAGTQAEYGKWHHLFAVQGHDAMGGTHEMHRVPAIGELIAHDLGNRQGCQGGFEGSLQTFAQAGALGQTVIKQNVGLAIAFAAQLRHAGGIGAKCGQLL